MDTAQDWTSRTATLEARMQSLRALIGNTPLIEIRCLFDGVLVRVFAKHELTNLTGSIKDRMALGILEEAWRSGRIDEGTMIAEATSGNTGIAFAALGRALSHPVRIYMPDWMSRERVMLIKSFGAEVVPVTQQDGGFLGSIALADRFAEETRQPVFLPHQFASTENVRAHERHTGPELLEQMQKCNATPQAFVAGVGTGGTVMGVGHYLKSQVPGIRIHPLEPANSPTMRTGCKVGSHRIQGISDEFIPPIVDLDALDEIVDVWDGDAVIATQRLAAELGLGVGISSGANLLGALQVGRELGDEACVATVFPDCNKKYLSTALTQDEPVEDAYLSPRVEFRGVVVHARLCRAEGDRGTWEPTT